MPAPYWSFRDSSASKTKANGEPYVGFRIEPYIMVWERGHSICDWEEISRQPGEQRALQD